MKYENRISTNRRLLAAEIFGKKISWATSSRGRPAFDITTWQMYFQKWV